MQGGGGDLQVAAGVADLLDDVDVPLLAGKVQSGPSVLKATE